MILFWIGIAVFLIGFALRYVYKYRYYRDYKEQGHTDRLRQELRSKYRPMIYTALVIEVIGCVISFISIWH